MRVVTLVSIMLFVSPSIWSWSLTQDLFRWTLMLIVKPYIRLAKFEVSCSTRLFSVTSFSLTLCHGTIWITTRLLLASLPSIFVIPPATFVRETLFSISCWKSDNLCFCNILGFSWACFLLLICCSTSVCQLTVLFYRALMSSNANYCCGSSGHSTLGC